MGEDLEVMEETDGEVWSEEGVNDGAEMGEAAESEKAGNSGKEDGGRGSRQNRGYFRKQGKGAAEGGKRIWKQDKSLRKESKVVQTKKQL